MVPTGTRFVGNGFFENGQFQSLAQFWEREFLAEMTKNFTKENVKPEDLVRFIAAHKNAIARLKSNPDCAKLFGGANRAISAIQSTDYSFRRMGGPLTFYPSVIGAITRGRHTEINLDGPFVVANGLLPFMDQPSQFADLHVIDGLGDLDRATLILLHELGHRLGIFGRNDKDDDPSVNDQNTNLILKNCFK